MKTIQSFDYDGVWGCVDDSSISESSHDVLLVVTVRFIRRTCIFSTAVEEKNSRIFLPPPKGFLPHPFAQGNDIDMVDYWVGSFNGALTQKDW